MSNDTIPNLGALLDTEFALYQLRRDFDVVGVTLLGGIPEDYRSDGPAYVRTALDRLTDDAAAVGIDSQLFGRALGEFALSFASEGGGVRLPREEDRGVWHLIQERVTAVHAELERIPPSRDKGMEWLRAVTRARYRGDTDYEAYVYLASELEQTTIDRISNDWRRAWAAQQQQPGRLSVDSQTFWVSRDFEDQFDAVAHYRCYERFRLAEFDIVFREVEQDAGRGLVEHASALEPFAKLPTPSPYAVAPLLAVWLVSRSERLSLALFDALRLVVDGVCNAQTSGGYWEAPITSSVGGAWSPDTEATARAVIVILKHSTSDTHRAQAARAVDWLLQQQSADGDWSAYGAPRKEANHRVLPTALALEAIVRSGKLGVESAIKRGSDWLIAAQDLDGRWEERSLPNPLLSVVVNEALDLCERPALPKNDQLQLVSDLLASGLRFSLEDSAASRQLALIATHTGAEAFVYGILELPQFDVRVLDDNKTIGLRKAVDRLQAKLQDGGQLNRGDVIPHSNGIERLGYLRDQVVHKALQVTASETDRCLRDAREFLSWVSATVLGYDVSAS